MSESRERYAKAAPKEKQPPKKEEVKKLFLKIDADQVRFSHILELKKVFRSCPGSSSIEIEFFSQEKKIGMLGIDSGWGVQITASLEEQIKHIASVKDLNKL